MQSEARPPEDLALTGPLLLWSVIQFGALLVALGRVPLAANHPRAGELLAANVMVVVQVVAPALLFPYLMRTWPAAIAVVGSAWPFDAVAGVFSAAPAGRVLWATGYVTVWLCVLAVWRSALPERGQRLAVGAATFATVGGCALFYLRLEFSAAGADAVGGWTTEPGVPVLAALGPLAHGTQSIDWLWPAAAMVLGLSAGLFLRQRCLRRGSGQVIHKS